MRPSRLVLEGFTAFRERIEVDFAGADLFALAGPTGAGKSSVLDAITFALYGAVPRYDDRRLVAPIISQGKLQARIRLDFTVGDEPYTAVRVVRANKKGASTEEARLEHRGDVVAGDADEVTRAVEALLGLSFEHFTTCVSLPQGDFARFLHEKPRERQNLLVRLLDLGVYQRMAGLARQRAAVAKERAAVLAERLERLSFATPAARDALRARLDELTSVRDRLDAAQPAIDDLDAQAAAARREAAEAGERVGLLAGVSMPANLEGFSVQLAEARAALDRAAEDERRTAAAVAAAEAALAALPRRADLEGAARDHDDLERLEERLVKGRAKSDEAVARCETAAAEAASAARARDDAATRLGEARRRHAAHDLALGLTAGDPCPICDRALDEAPAFDLADLMGLEAEAAAAARAAEVASGAAAEAERQRAKVDGLLADLGDQAIALRERLTAHPDRAALGARLQEVAAAEEALDAARAADKRARAVREAADAERAAHEREEAEHRRRFDTARDRVAALRPPAPSRVDLAADWHELVGWADRERPAQEKLAAEREASAADAEARRTALVRELAEVCRGAGIEPGRRSPRDAVVEALAQGNADLAALEAAITEAADVAGEHAAQITREQTAAALAGHLGARGFEKWVLDEALHRLVAGATDILRDLSGGAYSLTLEPRTSNFSVVDHANADAVRSARTLSGGETFLASLALALALADQVGELAATTTPRLEAIFLDEGFGTLDAATLDVVAAAIEELGSRGRMVGVVTHVRDLAERLPTRFEVRKGPGTSTIERIDS